MALTSRHLDITIRDVRSMTRSRHFQAQAAKGAVPMLGVDMLPMSSLSGSDEALASAGILSIF